MASTHLLSYIIFTTICYLVAHSDLFSQNHFLFVKGNRLLSTADYQLQDASPSQTMQITEQKQEQEQNGGLKGNSVVVAKDGSGNYRTVGEAVRRAPRNASERYWIHIKAGIYEENVWIDYDQHNLAFVGEGMGKTILTAKRSMPQHAIDTSGTLVVLGNGFLARDMTIENTAGPEHMQAVAMRCRSDRSAFYRVAFLGYQDTLYNHDFLQFYRECDIHGTIDFIFGDATVVFQNCNIYARKPLHGQSNIITAQGKRDQNKKSGTVFHYCKILASPDLQSSAATYLGRPWMRYSTTVVMKSFIEVHVHETGWTSMEGHPDYINTLRYREYENSGPGSGTHNRVKWPGYKVINSQDEARQYTVSAFLDGGEWIHSLQVPYNPGL